MGKFNTITAQAYHILERSSLNDTELRIRMIYEFSYDHLLYPSCRVYRVQLDDGIHWYIRVRSSEPARTFIYDLPEVPDLTCCTEEEYFQCSLVLHSSLDMDLVRAVQEYHHNVVQNNYELYVEHAHDISKDIFGIQK